MRDEFINTKSDRKPADRRACLPFSAGLKVELVKVNLFDLGFSKSTVYQNIVARAESLDLKLWPLILAAHLRLEYLDQPEGPYHIVASPKVGNSDSEPRGLYLRNIDGTLWLRGYCASDNWEYSPEMEFIFQRR